MDRARRIAERIERDLKVPGMIDALGTRISGADLHAEPGDGLHEYGDGGLVDWGAAMLTNKQERMMISGLSVDRLALDA